MNPLLECGNPITIPSWLYFTWRWVQLFGMAGVALYLVPCLSSLSERNSTSPTKMICHSFVVDLRSTLIVRSKNAHRNCSKRGRFLCRVPFIGNFQTWGSGRDKTDFHISPTNQPTNQPTNRQSWKLGRDPAPIN